MSFTPLVSTRVLTLLSVFLLLTGALHARSYWVYLTPADAADIYNSSGFSTIRSEVDTFYLTGHFSWVQGECLRSNTGHERLLRKGIELTSAVYFIILHGKYGGNANAPGAASVLAPYLNRALSYWNSAVFHGPAHMWTDCFNVSQTSCNCSGGIGWNEGDIALREWTFGTIASYDAIRDSLSTADRQTIDAWMTGVPIGPSPITPSASRPIRSITGP